MLLIIIVVAFILTIVLIECSSLFNSVIVKKEDIDNIYLEDSDTDDKIELLQTYTGKTFKAYEYNESVQLNLNSKSFVFFGDFDIFLNNTFKLKKCIVYQLAKDTIINIINYTGDIITIYTD